MGRSDVRRVLVGLVVAACATPPPKGPEPSSPPASLLTIADLHAAGITFSYVSATETLACDPDGGCTCIAQLDCNGECITLAENLATFRKALARDHRPVYCELADTGRFCDLSYFRFEGDIHRIETRYFDAAGKLVAQTNSTDYPEYCGGKSLRRIRGRVVDCPAKPREVDVICAEPRFRGRAGMLPNPKSWLFP